LLTPQVLVPTLLVPLIGYRLYRRFRANFGRQPVQPARKVVRLVILTLVAALFLAVAMHSMPALEAAGGGLLAGILLGALGVRHTRFDSDAQGRYYTPNSYIGGAVTLLLVTRLVYRMFSLYSTPQLAPVPGADPFAAMTQSPLTLTFVMLTVGYYLMYTAGVLYKSRSPQSPGG
jgi:uncharacterized membrane protein